MKKTNKRNGFTLIELLVVVAILAIVASIVLGGLTGLGNISKGTRAGTLQKFSYKGVVHSSYEGELLLGGIVSSGDNTSANVWEFSVLDPSLADTLNNLVGQHVIMHYYQTLFHNPLTRDTSYVVDEVSTNQ